MQNILLVDDEEKLRALLKRIISLEGYKVVDAATITSARHLLETQSIDIVLCDVKLPDGNGVDFSLEVKTKYPQIEIILLTAYGNIPDGVQAIKNGAFDYLVKGNDNDKIIPLLSRASEKVALQTKVNRLEKQLGVQFSFDIIIGTSAAVQNAIQLARKVAPTEAAVLLTGETGTGKEVFAQAIHYNSPRAQQPFVALNCSAFSKDLLESELFGHKAGAFTGANKDKKGLIEEAKGGTLFLDEIGEMPIDLQPKILRLLENGTYIRVGDTKEQKANLRIISATNRNMEQEIDKGHFRSDLYYRIAVFTIDLPSLRERRKDIPLLANHFLNVYGDKTNKKIRSISKEAIHALTENEWKGNVRELKNVMERAVIMEDSEALTLNSLPFDIQQGHSADQNLPVFHLSSVERCHILKMLQYTNGNKTEAARLMNIGVATLYRKLEEYGIK
ncbi:sigma-54-dependent Fis family transcriptional regulator [Flavipsychrobacter stenotrophus]|uniref:Sigma-54-dependent Fis family transcriptional regulator n=1 Tax=Flavipsychrobacter stenotrophus TaxID=2077091 RepID=A0A2S7T090_9BACT|nr:sigma-54 dependent transcriptional regulator [Flavipsychrobacter stenotrophus]PQJ12623.1 sigma-54-dependent Fis family transcriptional regulator [Flavipsychrobacter stenotrophus]